MDSSPEEEPPLVDSNLLPTGEGNGPILDILMKTCP